MDERIHEIRCSTCFGYLVFAAAEAERCGYGIIARKDQPAIG
jgi:hypothetical protein